MDEHAAAIMKMLRAGGPKIIRYEKASSRAVELPSRRAPQRALLFVCALSRGAAAVDLPLGGRGLEEGAGDRHGFPAPRPPT